MCLVGEIMTWLCLILLFVYNRYQVFGVAEYQFPSASSTTWQAYVDHIEDLPLAAPPEVFGLHANADIAKDHHEVNKVRIF